jgi:hypothetical protein
VTVRTSVIVLYRAEPNMQKDIRLIRQHCSEYSRAQDTAVIGDEPKPMEVRASPARPASGASGQNARWKPAIRGQPLKCGI